MEQTSGTDDRMQPSLRTARLRLDVFTLADATELHEIFSDPRTHTIGDGPFSSLDQTTAWIERRIAARETHGLCWYGLRERATERLIGNCGVFIGRTGVDEPELGYEIRRDFQGIGYATEAALSVITEAERVGIARIWATIRPSNGGSLKVVDRIGMVAQRSVRDNRGDLTYLARPVPQREGAGDVAAADRGGAPGPAAEPD